MSKQSRRITRGVDPGRVTALTVVLSLHIGLIIASMQNMPQRANEVRNDIVVSVIFIDRKPITPERTIPPRTQKMARAQSTRRPAVVPRSPAAPVARPQTEAAIIQAPHAQMVDMGGAPPGTRVASEEAGVDFRPDPMRRPSRRMDASVPRMRLQMVDSSLFGRVQAMQKARICGELRAALMSKSESTDAILTALGRYGCNV